MNSPDPYQMNSRYANQMAATVTIKRTPQSNAIAIAFGIFALLIALVLGLLVLLVIGIETGPVAFMLGLVTATIPVPLYVILVLWIDRYEAEPFWMLATAFLWGALVAPFFAFLLNTVGAIVVSEIAADRNAGEMFALVISAPIVEESAKAAILFFFFIFKKNEFDGVIDGIVYASLVALGFAMTENVQYYGKAAADSGAHLTLTLFIRGVMAPFSHPLFTSMTGIGLGLARQTRNFGLKLVCPVLGFLMAIFMHSIWNGSGALFGGGVFLLTYILVMVPSFLIVLIVIAIALRREGQVIRDYLLSDFQSGLFTREEYERLSSIFGRMGSSFNAFSTQGYKGWRTRRRYHQVASELAFHRCRVSRDLTKADVDMREMEEAYLHMLRGLTQEIRSR